MNDKTAIQEVKCGGAVYNVFTKPSETHIWGK